MVGLSLGAVALPLATCCCLLLTLRVAVLALVLILFPVFLLEALPFAPLSLAFPFGLSPKVFLPPLAMVIKDAENYYELLAPAFAIMPPHVTCRHPPHGYCLYRQAPHTLHSWARLSRHGT
jgi:hypothetical protein